MDKSYGWLRTLIPFANSSASEEPGSADSGARSARFTCPQLDGSFDPRGGYDQPYPGGADNGAGFLEPKNSPFFGWSKGRQGFGAVELGPSLLGPPSKFWPSFKCSEFPLRNVEGRGIEFEGLALDLPLRELEVSELLLNSWCSKLCSDIASSMEKIVDVTELSRTGTTVVEGEFREPRSYKKILITAQAAYDSKKLPFPKKSEALAIG